MQDNKINYYQIIANNLKNLRLQLKLSQEDFAEKLGCSREYISRLENNKELISLKMVLKVVDIFNINPELLFKK